MMESWVCRLISDCLTIVSAKQYRAVLHLATRDQHSIKLAQLSS